MLLLLNKTRISFRFIDIKYRDAENNFRLFFFLSPSIFKKDEYYRSFDHHSDETVTLSKLLPNINNFRTKMVDFLRKFQA